MSSEQEQTNNNQQETNYLDYIKFWELPEFKEYQQTFQNDVVQPSKEAYKNLPGQITDFKKEYVFREFNQNTRMIGLGFTTFLVAAMTKGAGKGLLKIVRNSAFSYIGLGTVFVPEVFNPYVQAPQLAEVMADCNECTKQEVQKVQQQQEQQQEQQ